MGNNYGLPLSRDEETNSEENKLLELQKKLSFMNKDRLKNKKYKFFSKEDADGNAIPFIRFKSDEEMSMDDVKRIFEENNSGPEPVPRALTAKKVNDYLEKANPTKREFINYFSSVELNKGGTPMKRQMEMFNEGGLSQEGGMVDEVSGNEVPMGSTREEVRDDIPAQVSEGEFIFPADVVRFIGLNQLMQMRQDAKMGLKKMDAMGQMGNSDEATMPDDMPFGIADLVVIDGPDEEEPQKKYKGGLAFANGGGIRIEDRPPTTQEVRTYVKEGSPDKRIPFFNGEPVIPIDSLLAQGYVLKGSDPVAETETEKAIPTRKSSDRTPMKKTPFQLAGGWGMDFKTNGVVDPAKVKLWTDEYEKTSGRTPAILTGIATVLAGPLGAIVHMANKGNAKNAAANYERTVEAAKQTNVEGQVAALQSINKVIVDGAKKPEGEDEEDRNILDRAIDKFKRIFGFDDTQAEEIKKVTIQSGNTINQGGGGTVETPTEGPFALAETPQQKTEREAREAAANANQAAREATKTETERMLSINDPKGTSLEEKKTARETARKIEREKFKKIMDDAVNMGIPNVRGKEVDIENQLPYIPQFETIDGPAEKTDYETKLPARRRTEMENILREAEPGSEDQKTIIEMLMRDTISKEINANLPEGYSTTYMPLEKPISNQGMNPADAAMYDLKQAAAEIGVDFDFETVGESLPGNYEEMFEQASQGAISAETILNQSNIKPVQDDTRLTPVPYNPSDTSIPTATKEGFFSNIKSKIGDVLSLDNDKVEKEAGGPRKLSLAQRAAARRKEDKEARANASQASKPNNFAQNKEQLRMYDKKLAGETNISEDTISKLSGAKMLPGTGVGAGSGGSNLSGPMNRGGLASRKKKKK